MPNLTGQPATAQQPILLCDGLTIHTPERVLVRDLSLTVQPGETVVIMGPSGVGKSVLADVLFGVAGGDGPAWTRGLRTEGTVGDAASQGALVPQFGRGLDHLWDWENIALARPGDRGLTRPDDATDVRAHSGGERRRLLIARGIAAGRALLWLDEPGAGLDAQRLQNLAHELKDHAARGIGLVVTTHQIAFAHQLADRVIWIDRDGTIETYLNESSAVTFRQWVHEKADAPSPQDTGLDAAPVVFIPGLGPLEALTAFAAVGRMRSVSGAARKTFREVWRLVFWRGAVFQTVVGAITAAIIYYSVRGSGGITSAVAWIPPLGMNIVLRVSQPLAAILVAASSGAAVSSWLGQQVARRELLSLEALHVDTTAAVRAPTFFALGTALVVHTVCFSVGMVAIFSAFLLAMSDAPRQEIMAFLAGAKAWLQPSNIALWLPKLALFPMMVAGVTVAFAALPKPSSSSTGDALTRGIVRATLAVILIELALLIPQAVS